MPVRSASQVPMRPVSAGRGVFIQVLIPPEEGPHFAMRRFTIQPGGWMPQHTNQVEHEQYVLQGRARIAIGDTVYDVGPGDVVFIPAGVPHWYKNVGEEDFVFLCLVPNRPDQLTILDPREPDITD
ncbi:MAG: cupin domain-containing protein [Chloroflexi bacterium]|nr:cupin domain-containing protein [Chloroflexota bacterium]